MSYSKDDKEQRLTLEVDGEKSLLQYCEGGSGESLKAGVSQEMDRRKNDMKKRYKPVTW
ncbi:predicted protein [Pyrenophora tritici-repentis Pt-1C-BFP]|uniref:Uncharacterized protein n=1 Tax=Pyrenophora tritici-repentis (strain Pt-1C-BFP) TaxID=426418 RepID=B2VV06_PYRTR|nr:uncharacterized protein PTRG_02189 [Pyrenophora tritici-repentis Pt-1C-BFP]EDU41627.1 predicted protein [Pyrenophora tritici-repentis Pt-1C-BFP]